MTQSNESDMDENAIRISDESTIQIRLPQLIGLLVGTAVGVLAYAELNSRITALEHGLEIQAMTVKENQSFSREWPLGLRGSLPHDQRQDSQISGLREKVEDFKEVRVDLRRIQLEMTQLGAQTATQEEKIETLFEIYNLNAASNQ